MDDVFNYLLNLAFDNKIGYTLEPDLRPYTPSVANAEKREIIINMNWHNKKELPFQVAHEIGHILNKDSGVLYFTSYSTKSKIESNANRTAIKLLAHYCKAEGTDQLKIDQFMDYFGIPSRLEYQVMDVLGDQFGI